MTAELHFVGATGSQLRQAGGRGDGPGEFRAPRTLVRLPGDTLAVYDAQRRAVELFSAEGIPIARRSVIDRQLFPDVTWAPSCATDLPILWGGEVLRCLPADSLNDAQQIALTEGLHRRAYRLAAISADGTRLDTLGIYLRGQYYLLDLGGGSIMDGGHPFLPESYVAVAVEPGFFYVAANPEYSIEAWNRDGKLQRIIRRPDSRREPTSAEAVRAWEAALDGVPESLQGRIRSLMADVTLLPAIHGLATGPEGELWVKREPAAGLGGPAVFDVFDANGRYIGEMNLSQDLTLVEVGADYLLGYVLDELDVPFVELFSLSRSGGSSTEE